MADTNADRWIRVSSTISSSPVLINLRHVSHVTAFTNTAPKHLLVIFFAAAPGSGATQAFEFSALADAEAARDKIYTLLNNLSLIDDVSE